MPDRDYELNSALGRCITVESLGYACYVGEAPDGRQWNGQHVGSLGTLDDAERWLRGDATVPPLRIYPIEEARG